MSIFKRKKSTVKPDLPKEYIWRLVYGEEEHEFKCLVTETEVVTYEDGQEHKHLKITDPTCMEGVLQIDTQTKIFGDMVDFQLERFIPYIRLEDGHWHMSHTTEDDRMQEQIAIYKKQSKQETVTGIIMLAVALGKQLFTGKMDSWWILIVFGIFFISSAAYRMVRLNNEINAIKEAEQAAEEEKAARDALRAEQVLEAPKTEEE